MREKLFNISSARRNTHSNKHLIAFVVLDLIFLLASIILGIFGLQDTPERSLDHVYAWLGISSMVCVVLLIIFAVFTFFYWINYTKRI